MVGVLGEITALEALSTQHVTGADYRTCAVGILVLGGFVVSQPWLMLGNVLNRHSDEPTYFRPLYNSLVYTGIAVGIVVGILKIEQVF